MSEREGDAKAAKEAKDAKAAKDDDRGEEFAGSEKDALLRLGAAVLELWDRMPRDRQQEIFSVAIAEPGTLDVGRLRRKLALMLHAHHERTSHAPSGDDAKHPPEGPHARPDLTNFDATPGSGLLSRHTSRDDEVDPGAG